jgi:hypothetical protein
MRKNLHLTLVAITGAALLGGCLGGSTSNSGGGQQTGGGVISPTDPNNPNPTNPNNPSNPGTPAPTPVDPNQVNLDARVVDYGQAARTAAVKLVGDLPTADELATVKDAASYAALVDKYLADPRFARQMLSFFQDEFKSGGASTGTRGMNNFVPSRDTAPTFAAELTVKDMDFRGIFTATTNTCPTLDPVAGTFTDAACTVANGLTTAGILTDEGIQSLNFSNMAMRRTRWMQETFLCTKFPAEFSPTGGVAKGNGTYVSPWPFDSITGGATAKIDFQDTSSVVCANCHTTMNHIAPLFAQFDAQGAFQTSIQVKVPVANNPTAARTDWLPAAEVTSYRYQQPAADLSAIGTALAADPATAQCQVNRVWNWAMDKGEIVNDAAVVPSSTTAAVLSAYTGGGYKLKAAIKATFTHDDFVKF